MMIRRLKSPNFLLLCLCNNMAPCNELLKSCTTLDTSGPTNKEVKVAMSKGENRSGLAVFIIIQHCEIIQKSETRCAFYHSGSTFALKSALVL